MKTPDQKLKIVFFGTGPVSRLCLEGIVSHFDIEAIITKPDAVSPHGKPHPTPVKDWAGEHQVPLHQPATEAELAALTTAGSFESPVGLVVDYGFLIPKSVIEAFPFGIVNSHFSRLPEWRGADPITFSVLSGQTVTGVSLMVIVPALDEGDLIATADYKIPAGTTTQSLTLALSELSNRLLIENVPAYVDGKIKPMPQNQALTPTYSRKLTKADGIMDWTKPAVVLEREIRAYLGWPGSRTAIAGSDVTVTSAHVAPAEEQSQKPAGTAYKTSKGNLAVATGTSALIVDHLKPAGKRDMPARDFLAGHPLV